MKEAAVGGGDGLKRRTREEEVGTSATESGSEQQLQGVDAAGKKSSVCVSRKGLATQLLSLRYTDSGLCLGPLGQCPNGPFEENKRVQLPVGSLRNLLCSRKENQKSLGWGGRCHRQIRMRYVPPG